ncbi:hypothetical protein B7R74_00480 [Yersinia pseudotuberculosis]|uniref:Protein of uncharacterized function (DUF3757) n=1 Tax=Yersinia pseudotuberculosis TaxID=633 RepID=A0A380Q4D2_YERPU|nr:DUF3757 domain-containing protein [Yersinia pseudotuberculosis]PSH24225.1 hypothetical protein B7R74_00480 [Yersinia pseudotuberculosis]SUP80601.1 Protein of uncharacterised function (DUF3757) [Yersinia pseudotuberculosis]
MMKYQLSFVLLLTPLAVFAEQHCPAIDAIKQIGGVYTAQATSGEEWVGILQGPPPQESGIKRFSEALFVVEGENNGNNVTGSGKFQKCTYDLQAEDIQLDMYYGGTTWIASVSGKPHWEYEKGGFFEIYTCSTVAPEDCKFDILVPGSMSR